MFSSASSGRRRRFPGSRIRTSARSTTWETRTAFATPTALFAVNGPPWAGFDVSSDGKRFLAIVPKIVADELPLDVIVNWAPETK
jgi:hypothetical protein